jgi:hypothetical protein
MKKTIVTIGLTVLTVCLSQAQSFTPGRLAVLQLGDGGTNRNLPTSAAGGGTTLIPYTNYFASDVQGSRQTALYIDEFLPTGINQTNPDYQVSVPTNDAAGGLFVNGNAGTEGGMTLSSDKSVLTFAGYTGDMLSDTTGQQTAPSNLSYNRGIATVDAFGNYTRVYSGGGWYGIGTGKTNPRGVATDGLGHFWGCGNGYGSLYFDDTIPGFAPIQFQNIDLTSCVKIFNGALYTSVKSGDVVNGLYPAGIYSFVYNDYSPDPYPSSLAFLQLAIPATAPYTNEIGFDINPQGNVCYVADPGAYGKGAEIGGIQKYVLTGSSWNLAYNLAIPGYTNLISGINSDPSKTNALVGCFSIAVDWSGTNPVIYATTSDYGNDIKDPYYGNRVIRINDTNKLSNGGVIILTTNMNILTTVARPGRDANGSVITNIIYKSVAFTPDLRPQITANPVSWSAGAGDNVTFTAAATSPYTLSYQWQSNGVAISGNASATTASLTLTSVTVSGYNNTAYNCVVSDTYGSVTSSIANLTVTATRQAPTLGSAVNITNLVGSTFTISANVTAGTDPKAFQWYYNGTQIADGASGNGSYYSGTASGVLTLSSAQYADAGAYSVVVTNLASLGGFTSNTVANLTVNYPKPSIVVPPASTTAFLNGNASFTVQVYDGTVNGSTLSYQWYTTTNATLPLGLAPITGGEFSGTTASAALSATLTVTGALATDATNYVVVVSNSGGSVTSSPVQLSLVVQPAHSFLVYGTNGAVYTQTFDALPINGGSSADAANPVSIQVETNLTVQDLTTGGPLNNYSLANPFDFAYPIIPSGAVGGLGVPTMNGWYAWASSAMKFGATYGDQSTGGIIDFGQNYLVPNVPFAPITNRALGMIATTKTEYTAFGLGILNTTTNTLNYINLSFLGELWRNNPAQQVVGFSYAVDSTGTNSPFNPGSPDQTIPGAWTPTAVHALDISFPVSSATSINDGTQSSNQVNLATNYLAVSGWTSNSVLWLVWEAQNPSGGAQAVAIDNLSFSATATLPATVIAPFNITPGSAVITGSGSSRAVAFSFTNATGLSFSVLATNNIAAPKSTWPVIGTAVENPPYHYSYTNTAATNANLFYILRQP